MTNVHYIGALGDQTKMSRLFTHFLHIFSSCKPTSSNILKIDLVSLFSLVTHCCMVFLLKFNKVIHTLNVLGGSLFQVWLKHNGSGRTTNECMAKKNSVLNLETH